MNRATPSRQSRQRLINISCFIIWFGYLSIQTALLWWLEFDLEPAINDSLVSATVQAAICFLTANALNYFLPSRKHFLHLTVWALTLGAVSLSISRWVLQYLITQPAYLEAVDQSLPIRLCFNVLIVAWMSTITLLWNFQEDREENEQRKADAERLAREAELHNLRQQLQPHFLFNSLNSIIALIAKQPDKAREMTFQLSSFLRGTLREDEQQFIPLREELDHLRLYLEIEKVRFGHRLETSIEADEHTQSAMIPSMILQPLMENAIKFGLYDTTGRVRITIRASINEDGLLTLEISNPYQDKGVRGRSGRKGTGFGLRGVRRRLFLLFGRTDLLETQEKPPVFSAIIRLPQRAAS